MGVGAEGLLDGERFRHIAERRSGGVGIDVVDLRRRHTVRQTRPPGCSGPRRIHRDEAPALVGGRCAGVPEGFRP